MYTVNDLLKMDLAPAEFKAACFMLTREEYGVVRIETSSIADLLNCSPATARRVLANLVETGLFTRSSRGVFMVLDGSNKRSLVSDSATERSLVSETRLVYVDDMVDMSTGLEEETDVSSSRGASAPEDRVRVKVMRFNYDDGDDLAGVGKSDDRPTAARTRQSRKRDLKFHRLTSREDWDVSFVVKEFRHRMSSARPDILGGGVDSRAMNTVLRMWQRDHGLSVLDMATAVDIFFENADLVAGLKETPGPWRVYLSFLQEQYRTITAANIDDDWLASLDAQMQELL